MPVECAKAVETTEPEFVEQLRLSTQRYLSAVDAWEAAYAKYYRLVRPGQMSSDLEPFQEDYVRAHKDLEERWPRARRMCLKYGLSDPFPVLLRVQLGANAPQAGIASAIGRAERNMAGQCLVTLEEKAQTSIAREDSPAGHRRSDRPRGLLRRIYDYFF